jgi:hypothetical protein
MNLKSIREDGKTRSVAVNGGGLSPHRKGEGLGFFTPLLLLVAIIVGAFTWYLAIVVCPLLGYFVSLKLCRRVRDSGGRPALKRYVKNALLGFIFWPILLLFVVGFLASVSDGDDVVDGGQALGGALAALFVLMAFGFVFLCWAIAAAWCWRSISDKDRPSERVVDVTQTRSL